MSALLGATSINLALGLSPLLSLFAAIIFLIGYQVCSNLFFNNTILPTSQFRSGDEAVKVLSS